MKKFLFSILAVGAIVACTKSEVNYEDASEISFAPVASTATKAAVYGSIDGTTYPENETFYVWGYWQGDVPAGSTYTAFDDPDTYISAAVFKKNNEYWAGWKDGAHRPYYWPKTGSIVFACLSPEGAPIQGFNKDQHSLAENRFEFAYKNPSNTSETVDLMWVNNTESYDQNKAGTNGVPVKYNHALSWITFQVKGEGATLGGRYEINSLTINDVNTYGSFNSTGNGSWSSQGTPADYTVFKGIKTLDSDYADLETNPKGTLVIPQTQTAGYTATIVYTNYLGDNKIVETIDLPLGAGWQLGVHYLYKITFTASEILIAPEVLKWTPEEKILNY